MRCHVSDSTFIVVSHKIPPISRSFCHTRTLWRGTRPFHLFLSLKRKKLSLSLSFHFYKRTLLFLPFSVSCTVSSSSYPSSIGRLSSLSLNSPTLSRKIHSFAPSPCLIFSRRERGLTGKPFFFLLSLKKKKKPFLQFPFFPLHKPFSKLRFLLSKTFHSIILPHLHTLWAL